MSELIQKTADHTAMRWKLLTGVSALVLTAYASSDIVARAEDSDRSQVWIELGGQLSRLETGQEAFSPELFDARPSTFSPSIKFEMQPGYSVDETGKISFEPKGSDWVFSVALHYGRSASSKHAHQQTDPGYGYYPSAFLRTKIAPLAARFADTQSRQTESHAILDFSVGKDVGLGMFGGKGSSIFNLGIRFAQFTGRSTVSLKSNPDFHFMGRTYTVPGYTAYPSYSFRYIVQPYHSNRATLEADRSFRGVGPSISWNASMPVASSGQDVGIDFDWGVNGALLFGRQKARVRHETTQLYNTGGTIFTAGFAGYHPAPVVVAHNGPTISYRAKSVIVPNIGGFAGVSFHYDAAKVSFGYKADFFFGAMDGGIDTRQTYDRNFYGPYATVSIGLGG